MKRLYIIIVLVIIWSLVALGCAIFKVSFDTYGIYWWIVAVLLIVLEYIEINSILKK
jgi:hypothetical protein